jgi:hypothetical protein
VALERADDLAPEPHPPVRRRSSAASLRALRRAVEQHHLQSESEQARGIDVVPPMAMPTNVEPIRLPGPAWDLAGDTGRLLDELLIAAERSAEEAKRSRRVALGVGALMPIFTLILVHLIS